MQDVLENFFKIYYIEEFPNSFYDDFSASLSFPLDFLPEVLYNNLTCIYGGTV